MTVKKYLAQYRARARARARARVCVCVYVCRRLPLYFFMYNTVLSKLTRISYTAVILICT